MISINHFHYLYFRFLCASALLDLHAINQRQSLSTNLTLLTPPAVPRRHSTLERSHSFHEDVNVTHDQDEIKHSFDNSMSNPTGEPVSFFVTGSSSNVPQSTSAMDIQVSSPAPGITPHAGKAPDGDYASIAVTPVFHSTFSRPSPLSQLLRRAEETDPSNQPTSNPNIVRQPQPVIQFGSFLTSSELEALELRLETLLNAKLQQFMVISTPGGPTDAVDSSVERESAGMIQSSSAAQRVPIEAPGKRRSFRHKANNETSDPCATKDRNHECNYLSRSTRNSRCSSSL